MATKTAAPNGHDRDPATLGYSLENAPGALRSEASLTINTRQAQKLFLGRPEKMRDGQRVHPGVVGVRRFATIARQVVIGARADDPYADQCLIELDREFVAATKRLADLNQEMLACLKSRTGVRISVAHSLNPITIPLHFHNQYAYRAAYLVADFDQVASAVLSAHHSALISRVGCERVVMRGAHWVRRVYSIPLRYRFSGACREDILQMTARGAAALEKFGPVPESILDRSQRPDYGAVRLSDGTAIIDTKARVESIDATPHSGAI